MSTQKVTVNIIEHGAAPESHARSRSSAPHHVHERVRKLPDVHVGGRLLTVHEHVDGRFHALPEGATEPVWTGTVSQGGRVRTVVSSLSAAEQKEAEATVSAGHRVTPRHRGPPSSPTRSTSASPPARGSAPKAPDKNGKVSVHAAYGPGGHFCCWSFKRATAQRTANEGGGFVKTFKAAPFAGDLPHGIVPEHVQPPKRREGRATKKKTGEVPVSAHTRSTPTKPPAKPKVSKKFRSALAEGVKLGTITAENALVQQEAAAANPALEAGFLSTLRAANTAARTAKSKPTKKKKTATSKPAKSQPAPKSASKPAPKSASKPAKSQPAPKSASKPAKSQPAPKSAGTRTTPAPR